MTRLPITVTPHTGEAWDSYVTRVAAAHHTTASHIADLIGLRQHGLLPAFSTILLAPSTAQWCGAALGITSSDVQAMQLSVYDGIAIDLTGLGVHGNRVHGAHDTTRRSWLFLTGSRYCSACLTDSGAWQLRWRLPWITGCTRHQLLLRARCPRCGQLTRSGKGEQHSQPASANARADGRYCDQPGPTPGKHRACDGDLTTASQTPLTKPQLAMNRHVDRLLREGHGTVVGRPVASLTMFQAWRTAACYSIALNAASGDRSKRSRPWLSPPRDPATMATIQLAGADLLAAPDAAAGAEVLRRWCETTRTTPTPATFRDAAPACPAIQPAIDELLRSVGRSHSILARTLDQLDPQQRLDITDYDVDDIPQLAWPCTLDTDLRHRTRPSADLLRAVVSLTLARIAGARTWAHAGIALGWTGREGTQWTRYVFSSQFDLRRQLVQNAVTASRALKCQPIRHRWQPRPNTHGPTPTLLAHSQRAACQRDDPTSWCPCRAPTV